jgi:PAS domain S-box-containing protein
LKFSDLVDIEELRQLCEDFTKITGTVTAILELDGNILVATGWQDICTRFHRVNPTTAFRCKESDTVLAGKLKVGELANIYKCKNGLIDVAVPIIIRDEHVATFFTGQFFLESPDLDFFIKQAKEFSFDKDSYLNALQKVPILSTDDVESMVGFFSRLGKLFGEMGLSNKELDDANAELRREGEIRSKRELEYCNLVEDTPDLITRVDTEGRMIFVNHAALDIFGLRPEECLGRSAFEFIHPEDREATMASFNDWMQHCENAFTHENRQISIDGQRTHHMTWTIRPEHDVNGAVIGFAGTAIDITYQNRLKEI